MLHSGHSCYALEILVGELYRMSRQTLASMDYQAKNHLSFSNPPEHWLSVNLTSPNEQAVV